MDSHQGTREPVAVAVAAAAATATATATSQSSFKRSAMLQVSAALNIALIALLFSQWGPTNHYFSYKQQQLQNTQAWQQGNLDVKNQSDHYIAPPAAPAAAATDDDDRVLCSAAAAGPRLSCSQSDHVQGCSGNGHYVLHGHPISSPILGGGGGRGGACHCHSCFSGPQCELVDPDCVLNVFQSVLSLSLSLCVIILPSSFCILHVLLSAYGLA